MFDVAVIGQGPAGGMAALRLAEAGHSVVAFDRKKRIGDPIHCGEGSFSISAIISEKSITFSNFLIKTMAEAGPFAEV